MLDLVLSDVTLPDGRVADLSIRGGIIVHAGAPARARETISCRGLLCLPGAVDMHVHMRGGSQREKEDWGSGSRAALAGGVTLVVDQPNTDPPIHFPDVLRNRILEAKENSLCHFAINGGVSDDASIESLWENGAMAFGEIFCSSTRFSENVSDTTLKRALRIIHGMGAIATIHAENIRERKETGLLTHSRYRSKEGEVLAVNRVKAFAPRASRLHFCHLSTVQAVKAAAPASAEVTPHHLLLSREDFDDSDARGKVNPPLRSRKDSAALWKVWDRIEVIASDHAPHRLDEKEASFGEAPPGMPGVETMIPLLLAAVLEKKIGLPSLIRKTSANPSRLLGIPAAGFEPGERADIALYPKTRTKVTVDRLHSRCGWTPFEGYDAIFPERVIMAGETVYEEGEFFSGTPRWFPGRGYIPGDTT